MRRNWLAAIESPPLLNSPRCSVTLSLFFAKENRRFPQPRHELVWPPLRIWSRVCLRDRVRSWSKLDSNTRAEAKDLAKRADYRHFFVGRNDANRHSAGRPRNYVLVRGITHFIEIDSEESQRGVVENAFAFRWRHLCKQSIAWVGKQHDLHPFLQQGWGGVPCRHRSVTENVLRCRAHDLSRTRRM